jgi:hypothetical protein
VEVRRATPHDLELLVRIRAPLWDDVVRVSLVKAVPPRG